MSQIENVIADLEHKRSLYEQNWVLPYGSSYAIARERFDRTIAEQRERDKFKAEILITIATIGFGAGLGAMFGKTALRTVVADRALTFVCDRNMTRTFNIMARVSASVPGTFIVDQLWSQVESSLSSRVKTMVESLTSTPASSGDSIANPQVFQNDLLAYVLRAKNTVQATAIDIRDNGRMSAADKDRFAAAMRESEFFRNAPTHDVIGNRDRAAEAIELAMYLPIIMDADYIEERTQGIQGTREVDRRRRVGSITAATSDPTYGQVPAMRHSYGLGYSLTTTYGVAYDRPGSVILDRVNALHQRCLGRQFISNRFYDFGFGREDIARAERSLEQLNQQVLLWGRTSAGGG